MPRHTGVNDHIFVFIRERAKTVVDLVIDLGVRFHIFIHLNDGHAVRRGNGATNGTRRIVGGTQALNENFGNRAFPAAEISC